MTPARAIPTGFMTVLEKLATGPLAEREAWRFEDQAVSFRELRDRAYRIANGLSDARVRKGDRIAILLRNCLEWVELFHGIAEAGAVCTPVNVLLRPAEITYLCEDSEANVFVVDRHGVEALEQSGARPDLVIAVGGAQPSIEGATVIAFEDLYAGAAEPNPEPPSGDDILVLYYSSGTTGLPKAAIHTHENVVWNSFAQIVDLEMKPEDTFLVVPSLSWAAGFHSCTFSCSFAGGRCVLMPTGGMSVDRIVETAQKQGVTRTFMVPTLLRQLLASPEALQGVRDSKLRWIVTGAEPVSREMMEGLIEELPECSLVQGYGMSEFPTVACVLQPQHAVDHAGSAGRAGAGVRMAIETPEGVIADSGEGEILLRSRATMLGYWNRPEETEAAFQDNWFHTGDIGDLDEEGFVTITGRKKDMIISGGLNVYPSEAEAVILAIEGVREVAVVGLPDDRMGEVPVAVVVGEGVTSDAVLDRCKEALATYKAPKRAWVRDEALPRNPNGKVLKRELRPWVAEQAGVEPAR
jgi:acyl-CoA synthetase (AMP-forming)/AMP-acid ligase II